MKNNNKDNRGLKIKEVQGTFLVISNQGELVTYGTSKARALEAIENIEEGTLEEVKKNF